jgi:hypothetical protein
MSPVTHTTPPEDHGGVTVDSVLIDQHCSPARQARKKRAMSVRLDNWLPAGGIAITRPRLTDS